MPYKPNAKLPKGARRLDPPRTMKLDSWAELTFDAEIKCLGVTWYRVQGGFGHEHNKNTFAREDWVAEINSACISVSDYNWTSDKTNFGTKYPSFEEAMRGEMQIACHTLEDKLCALTDKMKQTQEDFRTLFNALYDARTS